MITKKLLEEAKSDPTFHLEKIRREIEKKEKDIKAFISLNLGDVEKEIKKERTGKLAYLLISVKDNILVKNLKATAASKILENYIAPYDATVIERIKKEGAIIIGKTNLDEFACGSDGTNSAFFVTKNPFDLERVPGGSSSGSVASLAANFCDLSLGSDTGGSIRNPAAFCSLFGFKPSYGVVSRYGLIDLAMSMDQIGPFAKDTYGIALLLDVIHGKDEKDVTTVNKKFEFVKSIENFNEKELSKRKIAYATEFLEYCEESIRKKFFEVLNYLSNFGIEIREVSIPEVSVAVATYYLVVSSEFSSAMQKFDGLKYGIRIENKDLIETILASRSLLGKEVKRRILIGTFITSREGYGKWYRIAMEVRSRIKEKLEKILSKFDYLVSPTMPVKPWKIGEKKDPIELYQMDVLTVLANLARIPAISIPVEKFIGFQVMSGYLRDDKILEISKIVEEKFKVWK